MRRRAAAGADVKHTFLLGKQIRKLPAIDDIAADKFLIGGVPREIQTLVPIPETGGVAIKRGDLLRR